MNRRSYRAEVLEELAERGLRPLSKTDPALVREQLNDLYRLELRSLRQELRRREREEGKKLRGQYSLRVTELRNRYRLLSEPIETWMDQQ